MDPTLVKALAGGIAVVAAAAVAAAFQYAAKVREERRLLRVALVEADTKVAGAFGELIGRSHGRGRSELSEALVQALLAEGDLVDTVRRAYADYIRAAPDKRKAITEVFGDLPVSHPIGTDDMDATLHVLAALGRKHDVLTRGARGALEGRAIWKPLPGATELIADLKKQEAWNRMGRMQRLLHPRRRP
ncbi:hypothetical protein [Streptomyces lydicus]|uniref:hypothetical protein n=1 Tax=Streptomyces lydicus TaxID=47763 RepID=UPI00131C7EC2|nr:hypothetical protein [Streptomyces lydicus]